jgi:hypothetical protein
MRSLKQQLEQDVILKYVEEFLSKSSKYKMLKLVRESIAVNYPFKSSNLYEDVINFRYNE